MAPHSVADFAEAFAAVCRSGAAGLRVVGAATKLRGASIAPEAVSTRNLAALPDYRPADLTLTAQAGAPIAELRRVAERDNLALPIDAADFDGQATLGGVVADNDVGPCGLALGMPRDAVLGATVVLGDGTLVRSGGRVLKNSAGYACHRLLAGSRGQLARWSS
ncbi:MAG: FAD-binding protein [Phycisphaerae bacterium]